MLEDVDANASTFVNIHVVDSMSEIRSRNAGRRCEEDRVPGTEGHPRRREAEEEDNGVRTVGESRRRTED